jgi:hypothetical protein
MIEGGSQWANQTDFYLEGLKISGITFIANEVVNTPDFVLRISGSANLIEDCVFTHENPTEVYPKDSMCSFSGDADGETLVRNCVFTHTKAVKLGSYSHYNSNTNYGTMNAPGKVLSFAGRNIYIKDNYYTHEDITDTNKVTQGRFAVLQNQRAFHFCIEDNTTEDTKPMLYAPGLMNTGEQILFENSNVFDITNVTAATSNTLTSPLFEEASGTDLIVTIVEGPGFGQSRAVLSFTDEGGTNAVLQDEWEVIPDATSMFCLHKTGWRGLIIGNYLDGTNSGINSASAAVSMYGGPEEVIVRNNTANQIEDGFIAWAFASYDQVGGVEMNPCYFNVFDSNTNLNSVGGASNGYESFHTSDYKSSGAPDVDYSGIAVFATIFRDNVVSNANEGLYVQNDYPLYDVTMTVMEGNSGTATNAFFDECVNTYTNGNNVVEI